MKTFKKCKYRRTKQKNWWKKTNKADKLFLRNNFTVENARITANQRLIVKKWEISVTKFN